MIEEIQYIFLDDKIGGEVKKGDVRRAIILSLMEHPLTVTQLAKTLRVSKPTVTYHISKLKREGFVELSKVEVDTRGFQRRYYMIKESVKLRAINHKAEEDYQKVASSVISQLDMELRGKRLREPLSNYINISFLRMLHMVLYRSGVKLDGVLRDCGRKVGKEVISKHIIGSTFKEILSDVGRFWEKHELGRVEVVEMGENHATIRVYDCYDCANMPNIGKTICHLDEGMLSGIFEAKLGDRYEAVEVKCWGNGYTYCEIRIDKHQ